MHMAIQTGLETGSVQMMALEVSVVAGANQIASLSIKTNGPEMKSLRNLSKRKIRGESIFLIMS